MKISAYLQRKHAWFSVVALCCAVLCCGIGELQTFSAQNFPALNRDAILGHLNAVITWYRDADRVQAGGLPSDEIYEESTRHLAAEVVRLAFQWARAEAAVIGATEKSANANQASTPPAQQQDLTQIAARISAEIDDTQSRLDDLNKQLASAPPSKRKALLAERERLQGKLSLDK